MHERATGACVRPAAARPGRPTPRGGGIRLVRRASEGNRGRRRGGTGRGAPYLPYFWNSHSLLHSGQTGLVLSHREMQWKWKAWLQTPHATVQSSLVALACGRVGARRARGVAGERAPGAGGARARRRGARRAGRRRGAHLVRLALDAKVHNVVPADGAVVHDDV